MTSVGVLAGKATALHTVAQFLERRHGVGDDVRPLDAPKGLDGISILPTMLGREGEQKTHEYLYWEHGTKQAIRKGDWKAVRRKQDKDVEVYHLGDDPGEENDLASQMPEKVAEMAELMKNARVESELFPLK